VARDKAVYSRLRQAYAASKSRAAAAAGCTAAGALAVAARELRPAEIVGLYEQQREALEAEAAGLRAEVGRCRLGAAAWACGGGWCARPGALCPGAL
jgi:hypothetical protein